MLLPRNRVLAINDYAGVQNSLRLHSEFGDESLQSDIESFTILTGRSLVEDNISLADLNEKISLGKQVNLNTMIAAVV